MFYKIILCSLMCSTLIGMQPPLETAEKTALLKAFLNNKEYVFYSGRIILNHPNKPGFCFMVPHTKAHSYFDEIIKTATVQPNLVYKDEYDESEATTEKVLRATFLSIVNHPSNTKYVALFLQGLQKNNEKLIQDTQEILIASPNTEKYKLLKKELDMLAQTNLTD